MQAKGYRVGPVYDDVLAMAWFFLELIVKSMALEKTRLFYHSLPLGKLQGKRVSSSETFLFFCPHVFVNICVPSMVQVKISRLCNLKKVFSDVSCSCMIAC